jgi:molecular chaperone DnaK
MTSSATKPITLGIDFGTTNTCVAYVRGKVAKCVPTDKGNLVLPSVVAQAERGDLLVGTVAKDQMVVNPRNTIYGIKRLIGRQYQSKTVQEIRHYFSYEIVEGAQGEAAVVLGGKQYSAPEVSAFILSHCKRVAETFLQQSIEDAVIAVPAYFNDSQRQAVKLAGKLAGLNVKRIVNEPTAAALAYGFNRGFDQKILIYDLGGGTFDLSVLQLHGNVFEVIATGGDTFLGGVDFDNRIIDYVLEEFRRQTRIDLSQSPVAMQRIKSAAESAKIDLSVMANVQIELPYIEDRRGKPVDLRMPLSRERLNALTMDMVDRTFSAVGKTVAEKNLDPRSFSEILLVGGQTRMPLVQGKAHQYFGRAPRKGVHPDECVALGAALLGDSLNETDSVTLVDVLSVPIGIALPGPGGRFRRIIDKNSTIPLTRSFRLPPAKGPKIDLEVFQGESDRVVENEYLGALHFPARLAGAKVNFEVDEECFLNITVDLGDGSIPQKMTLVTRDTPQELKDAWKAEMERRRAAQPAVANEAERGGLFSSLRKIWGG